MIEVTVDEATMFYHCDNLNHPMQDEQVALTNEDGAIYESRYCS